MASTASPRTGDPRLERKLATVLFADRVGFTQASDAEDPERTRALQDRLFEAMAGEVERAGGTLEKFVGDALMAAFGAPASLEDHAERALHAALAMLRKTDELFESSLQLRIGINTGEIVVGPAREGGSFVTGDAVNVAARLEQAAAPGEILVGTRTAAAVRGAFEFAEPRTIKAKGKPDGIPCSPLVRALSLMRSRGVRGAASTLVGRENELALLGATFERAAREATPNLITIMGAPGVGKTRLVREFWHALGAVSPVPLRHTGRCLPYGSGITYWPLAEVLKEHFGLLENDQQEQIHRRLGDQRVLGLTLGLEVAGLPPFAAQEALHEAWVGFISSLAREQQVIILIEDLHWGDDPLLDLLERLVGEVEGPLMLLGTARPELLGGRAAWGAGRRNTSLVWLEPLASTDVERMLSNVVGELPEALRSLVVERAEGNPLFVEELLEALIDQGVLDRTSSGWTVRDVPQGALPDSLNALLAARIDLLETAEKDALQAAAVIGRTFWEGAVRELANGEEPDFGVLEERDFVRRRPGSTLPDEREYVIKHALTRDVAYGAIPKAKRARLHAAFAEWLERTTAGRDEHAAILAHHYGESVRSEDIDLAWQRDADEVRRLREKAIRWRRRAAEVAVARGELSETPALAHPALELLDQLPRTPELAQEELALQMLLGVSFSATKGFAAPEAGSAYARARELCQQAGDAPQLFPVLFGLWSFYLVRGELRTARELANRMRALALAADDPALLLESENMLGATLYFQGEHDRAREHLGEALALYKPELHHAHAFEYGQDPGVFSLTNIALVEAVLGLDEEATRASEHAIELARSHGHFYSLTFALTLGAVLTQFQRDAPSTSKRAKEALELATEYAFPQLAAWAAALVGWVHAEQGQHLEGATAMRESVEASKAMGAELTLPYFLGLLAETCDAPDEALASLGLVDEALAGCERRGEHLWEAELLRIRGRLQMSLGRPADARASFERGAEVASSQGAKLFGLHLEDELEGRAMQRL